MKDRLAFDFDVLPSMFGRSDSGGLVIMGLTVDYGFNWLVESMSWNIENRI